MNPLVKRRTTHCQTSTPDALNEGARRLFSSRGILGQSAEARGAEIVRRSIALDDEGAPMHLPGLKEVIDIEARDAFPCTELWQPALRDEWRALMEQKNPSLRGVSTSRPVVTMR